MQVPSPAILEKDALVLTANEQNPPALPAVLATPVKNLLGKMFRDPRILEIEERADLITQLREAVGLAPQVTEIRVLLGMALCVDLQAQQAMQELREAIRMEPDNFIAQLKLGELLMRLRVCDQASDHTRQAARLASNAIQAELARRQAEKIRTMMREGIERGGYASLLARAFRRRKSASMNTPPVLVGSE